MASAPPTLNEAPPTFLLWVHSLSNLAWLSVWSEVQICIWPSRCHCRSLSLALVNPGWFYLSAGYWLNRVVPDKIQKSRKTTVVVVVAYETLNVSQYKQQWMFKNSSLNEPKYAIFKQKMQKISDSSSPEWPCLARFCPSSPVSYSSRAAECLYNFLLFFR